MFFFPVLFVFPDVFSLDFTLMCFGSCLLLDVFWHFSGLSFFCLGDISVLTDQQAFFWPLLTLCVWERDRAAASCHIIPTESVGCTFWSQHFPCGVASCLVLLTWSRQYVFTEYRSQPFKPDSFIYEKATPGSGQPLSFHAIWPSYINSPLNVLCHSLLWSALCSLPEGSFIIIFL